MFPGFWRNGLWFCHGPKPEHEADEDWADQWYIPGRALCLVRSGMDAIVLPGGRTEVAEFAEFCSAKLELEDWQILWTSGSDYLLDEGIRKELLPDIRRMTSKGQWMLAPYCQTKPFARWASEVNVPVLGDCPQWAKLHADKGILHPHVRPERRPAGLPLLEGINVPRGWICDDLEDLKTAFGRLTQEGAEKMILKPRFSSAGEGMVRDVTTWEQLARYDFGHAGQLVIEEMLNYSSISSIQFYQRQLVQPPTDQLLSLKHASKYAGNVVPSQKDGTFQETLTQEAQRILNQIHPKGLGALDFLAVNGQPRFIDPNLGRWTGGWIGRAFHLLTTGGHGCYKKWDLDPEDLDVTDIWTFWERLNGKGIAFQPGTSTTGVFPMCWLPNMWVTLFALGRTHHDVEKLEAQALECL